jgi:heat shock protein HtpX
VKPESYWDDFLIDLVVTLLPVLGFLLGIVTLGVLASTGHFSARWIALIACITGAALVIKTRLAYRHGAYPAKTVASLLQEVKVSPVRPIPATITGTIIGKGVPGLIWSEDFIVQDSTGIVFLDYRQPLRIWEWFFGLLKAGTYQGKRVTIRGWFRRAPVPYIEIGAIRIEGEPSERLCYVRHAKLLCGLALLTLGLLLFSDTARTQLF